MSSGGDTAKRRGKPSQYRGGEIMSQGSRTERVTAAVTPDEKRRIYAVARHAEKDVSNLLRLKPIRRILAEFEQLPDEAKRAA
jgi:hypothetical protein